MKTYINFLKFLKYLKEINYREYLIDYEISSDGKFSTEGFITPKITEDRLFCKNLNHAQELLEHKHNKKIFITSFRTY